MKPLDPRLLKYAKAAKRYIIEIAILGIIASILVIAQAFLISGSISPVISEGVSIVDVLPKIGWLAAIIILRGFLIYFRESRAHRAADDTIATLREKVVKKAVTLGPRWRAHEGTNTVTLVTRGLDDLDPYFVKYLPQLIMVCTVTPITLLTILFLDFWSALVALITIPLIPIFMILIGRLTQSSSRRKLISMERLGSQLLDLLTGLPTLRALGREKGPKSHLVRLSQQNTKTTMQTLRIAFLSGGVLEFLATLSVALVAVEVGFRMVSGHLDLFTGLIIIMLAPEVYDPLRQVGAQFHASANGVAAANACFEILEQPDPTKSGSVVSPSPSDTIICFDNLSVAARGAWSPDGLSAKILPRTITALSGPSGAGKTTTAMVLLGLENPTLGNIMLESHQHSSLSINDVSLESWWENITWVPQAPTLLAGSVLQNVLPATYNSSNENHLTTAFLSKETLESINIAALKTGFESVVNVLPNGWDTLIGTGGLGLSVGQRQRLALTRALVIPPKLLVLDEPTAHLDAVSEEQIVRILRDLQQGGSTIVVIAHRQAVLNAADNIIEVRSRKATVEEINKYPQLSSQIELEDLDVELPKLLDPVNAQIEEETQS